MSRWKERTGRQRRVSKEYCKVMGQIMHNVGVNLGHHKRGEVLTIDDVLKED